MAAKKKSCKRHSTRNSGDYLDAKVKGSKSFGAELAIMQSTAYVADDLTKVAWAMYHGRKVDMPTAEIALGDLKRLLEDARGDEFKTEVRAAIKHLRDLIAEAERPKRRWPWSV